MQQNIFKYYLFQFFYAMSFAYVPFFVLFMKERGLSYEEIGMTQGIYYVLFLLFDLPTGVIADKWGRKLALALTAVIKILALVICIFSYSFYFFVVAEFLFSLSRAFASGSGSAFLYDSLLYTKESHNYKKIQGKALTMHLVGNTIAALIGGVISYFVDLQYVYIFSVVFAFAAFFVALRFQESMIFAVSTDALTSAFNFYGSHLIASVKEVILNKFIIWVIFYSSFIFVLIRANLISLMQPLLIFFMMPKFMFGIIDTVTSLGAAIFSYFSDSVENKIGFKKTFLLMPLIMLISYLGMGLVNSKLAIVFVFIQMFTIGIYPPIVKDYIQKEIVDSKKRATILSMESMLGRGTFSVFAMFLGYVLHTYDVKVAMTITAVFAFVGSILLFVCRPRKIRDMSI